MAALLTPPKSAPFSGVRPVHWTVESFHRAREANQLDGERTFLLRGVLLEQGPMNPPHASIVAMAQILLGRMIPVSLHIRTQLPLVLSQRTDPMPDLAIVEGQPKNYAKRHPTTAELVVEVSDTTLKLDLGDKAELYAAAGIADYWVIDVSNRYLIVHRDPDAEAEAYRSVARFGLGDTVAPLAVPDRPIAVADLLPESP